MKIVSNPRIENDELICPITLEVFRDPVIAKDGHIYERAAITQWIFEHGTSPLTREPLQIEELQPDDHLRRLATQQRNSTMSYNIHLDRVPLPALQPVPPIVTQIHPYQFNSVFVNYQRQKCDRKRCVTIAVSVFCVFIIFAAVIGATFSKRSESSNYSRYSTYKPQIPYFTPFQTYSKLWTSSLTTNSTKFYTTKAGDFYYYKAIEVSVSFNNIYSFKSNSIIHLRGRLYNNSFTEQLSTNLLTYNTDDNGDGQFHVSYYLQFLKKYILVVTTRYANTTGPFTIVVTSSWTPAHVSLYSSSFK